MANAFNDEDEITGINITPLVDIVLVLLIVFMATATYIVNRSLDVKLPSAETAQSKLEKTRFLSFVLDSQSKLFMDGKEINYTDLKDLIQTAKQAQDPLIPPSAIISADTMTPHGEVVKLIDMIRKNGINDFAINVEAKVKE